MLADAIEEIRRAHAGLEVRADILGGNDPIDTLVGAATESELLALGSRGSGGFSALTVGSISLAVTARCDVPVVMVRAPEADRRPGRDARRWSSASTPAPRPRPSWTSPSGRPPYAAPRSAPSVRHSDQRNASSRSSGVDPVGSAFHPAGQRRRRNTATRPERAGA